MRKYTSAELFEAMVKYIQQDEDVADLLSQCVAEGEAEQLRLVLSQLIEERG